MTRLPEVQVGEFTVSFWGQELRYTVWCFAEEIPDVAPKVKTLLRGQAQMTINYLVSTQVELPECWETHDT